MSIYDNMVAKLPAVMRQENVLKYYAAIAELLEHFDSQLEIFKNVHLVDSATGIWLDELGKLVNVFRDGDTDNDYRARISFEFFRYYYAPTLTNLLAFTLQFSGFYPSAIEGINFGVGTEPAYLKFIFGYAKVWDDYITTKWDDHLTKTWDQLGYVFNPDFDPTIIENLDRIAGAGVKLETDY